MNLTGFRDRIASLLDLDPEWTVHSAPVDSAEPPAFVLVWSGSPTWIEPSTVCADLAQLDVIVLVPRLDVGDENYRTLETMVDAARGALSAARVPVPEIRPPGPFELGGITYLAARIVVRELVDKPDPVATPVGRRSV